MSEETTYDYTKPRPKDNSFKVVDEVFCRFLEDELTFEQAIDELTARTKMMSGEAHFNVNRWRRYKRDKKRQEAMLENGDQALAPKAKSLAKPSIHPTYWLEMTVLFPVILACIYGFGGGLVADLREALAPWRITGGGVDWLVALAAFAVMYGTIRLLNAWLSRRR